MDRKITKTANATLLPAPDGWRAIISPGTAQDFATVAEAAAAIPQQSAVSLALPVRLAIFERLTLPSTDRDELSGMILLQLEKTLPYPVEETTYGFEILTQTETESTVLATVVHNPTVEDLCTPLTSRRQYPQRLSIWAMHIAKQAPAAAVACALWKEEGSVVFAVFENEKLSFSEIVSSPDELLMALPQLLMSAELAGVSTEFCATLLDPSLAEYRSPIEQFLGAPVEELKAYQFSESALDLGLQSWKQAVVQMGRAERIRNRLILAGVIYLFLFCAGLAYLGIMKHRLRSVENQLTVLQPQMDAVLAEQARWTALKPATDYRRYTVEILFQIYNALPQDVTITQFDQGVNQFMVEGEAPNAGIAIEFVEKLKKQPGLSEYRFEAGPPSILPNEHAQFKVFGKL